MDYDSFKYSKLFDDFVKFGYNHDVYYLKCSKELGVEIMNDSPIKDKLKWVIKFKTEHLVF